MKNWHTYHIFFITIFMICALNSWGSEPLPQLPFNERSQMINELMTDTVPAKKPPQSASADNPSPDVDPQPARPVTKRVPRSRKKLKPAAVAPVRPPAVRVVKPKIVIKKINVKIP